MMSKLLKHLIKIFRPGYLDDEFERAANESTNGGGSWSNNAGLIGTGGNQYMKQKDFIIKKMFKVPSNEQMTAPPGITQTQYNSNVVNQSGAFSAKGPSSKPVVTNGFHIYNVNESTTAGTAVLAHHPP